MRDQPPTQLKEWFNEDRYRWFADVSGQLCAAFDRERFLAHVLEGLEGRELLARLRRTTEGLHIALPGGYGEHLAFLRRLAPRIGHSFVGMIPCDYVGCYGQAHFDRSMAALAEFTEYGSGEFAVREYLRLDFDRALAFMLRWASDANEHVRRLASEGSRPRLPWSFRLTNLVADPAPTRPILEALRVDPSLYVRKSVANHLNDISKDHPGLMLDWLQRWDLGVEHTDWIARHACRTLIKAGDPRALALFKVGVRPRVDVSSFAVAPRRVRIGDAARLSVTLESRAAKPQLLVVDFAVHFVRAGGRHSRKVFKWKSFEIGAKEQVILSKKLVLQQRSTRRLLPGSHKVELLVNGSTAAETAFSLLAPS